MNSWNFTGNLGRDAEQRFTTNGDSVVSFSVGVKSGFGEKASTTWVNCSMFGKRGESALPYLKKGTQVGIVGEVNNREYQDKDGQKRYSLDVRVSDMTLLGGKSDRSESAPSQPKPQQRNAQGSQGGGMGDMDDDIPFAPFGSGKAWRVI